MGDITTLLTHQDIMQRITRMAWQVFENYVDTPRLILLGIPGKGSIFCQLTADKLREITGKEIWVGEVHMDKNNPDPESMIIHPHTDMTGQHVILIDDVMNSGKTMMYAIIPILSHFPASLKTLVLANRDHKDFPIRPDIVGISLSTTRQEHITFDPTDPDNMRVYLS